MELSWNLWLRLSSSLLSPCCCHMSLSHTAWVDDGRMPYKCIALLAGPGRPGPSRAAEMGRVRTSRAAVGAELGTVASVTWGVTCDICVRTQGKGVGKARAYNQAMPACSFNKHMLGLGVHAGEMACFHGVQLNLPEGVTRVGAGAFSKAVTAEGAPYLRAHSPFPSQTPPGTQHRCCPPQHQPPRLASHWTPPSPA